MCGLSCRDKSDHLVAGSLRSVPQDNCYLTALSDKTNVFSVTSGEPLKHVINLCGPLMASRKLAIRDEPNIRFRCSTDEIHEADDDSPPPHPHSLPSVGHSSTTTLTNTTNFLMTMESKGAKADGRSRWNATSPS